MTYKVGDTRIARGFLFLPLRLEGEWKWLTNVVYEEKLQKVDRGIEINSYIVGY